MKQRFDVHLCVFTAALLFLAVFNTGCSSNTEKKTVLQSASFTFQLEDTAGEAARKPVPVLSNGRQIRLSRKVLFTNLDLADARIRLSQQTGRRELWLIFNREAALRLQEITRRNIGKQLAIIVDGQVWMAPQIMQTIRGGQAVIAGPKIDRLLDDLVKRIKARS